MIDDATIHLPVLDPHTLRPAEHPSATAPDLPPQLQRRNAEVIDFGDHALALVDHGADALWIEISLHGSEDWQSLGAVRDLSRFDARVRVTSVSDRNGTLLVEAGPEIEADILECVRATRTGGAR